MADTSTSTLALYLVVLIILSAFFSSSETGMLSLNRYRLKHLSKRSSGARRAQKLLRRPDRLIGLILIGNNAVNILAAIIAEVIFSRLFGVNAAIWTTTILLTLIMLVFAEVTPKTIAAVHPEAIAFRSSQILRPLMRLLLPLVIAVNWITNSIVRIFGIDPTRLKSGNVGTDELRMVVNDASNQIPDQHQDMLLNVLDLDNISIEDIMVPRNEIYGLDITADPEELRKMIIQSEYTRLPLYENNINNIVGVLHMRKVNLVMSDDGSTLSIEALKRFAKDPYFMPENTPLSRQLINFQKAKQRMGFLINEYGDIQGMATLDDLLEEIVGSYTTTEHDDSDLVVDLHDGSFVIDGTATIREINKITEWDIPTDGPKTINGLSIEHIEDIPDGNVCFRISGYHFETLSLTHKGIEKVLVKRLNHQSEEDV